MRRFLVLAVILGMIGSGCAQRKVVTPSEAPQEATEQKAAKEAQEAKKGPEKITEQKMEKVESKEVATKVEEVSGIFDDIHFDYDKYDIKENAKAVLKSVADHLIKSASEKILVEGHCDERGTSEYNLGLGDRRAKATKDYLISLGVPANRIETISYGKEKPLCNEHTEDCWAKNRRAHFVVMKGKK
ncbi:MAG TPA: peptidoglycan-associated lipoprotein Pal [Thermodesulfovibrionales bacterium]|jgi:peptidoglycan-associated lipoprotein|nr:peptidoglycan-associated lipoprotein Pal [Thermodesulfovibrionales bacterium]